MPQMKKKSHASTPGPPDGSMPAVNSYRDESGLPSSRMKRDEGRFRRPDCVHLKSGSNTLKIGTWNVRTLNQLGKLENLRQEADALDADIIGISEVRYIGEGKESLENYTFIYSGGEKHQHGVGFMLKSSLQKYLIGHWPLSERNIMIKLKAKPFNLAIIQTYAPTSSHSDEEVEAHYQEIDKMLKEVKSTDVLIVLGDFNAKLGNESFQNITGDFGLGKRNERGDRLIQFCIENNLIASNTFFQHPKRLLYTWKSPGDISRNQIDYILIRHRHRNSVKQCKTYPGADIGSDHNPLIAKIKIRLKRATPSNTNKKEYLDWGKLKNSEMSEKYLVDVQNRYEVLCNESPVQIVETNFKHIDKKWECFKNSIEYANTQAPKQAKVAKQKWMTTDILEMMEERKSAKDKPDYVRLNKEIQRKCREAKENWISRKCNDIEESDRNNGTKKLHADIKELCGTQRKSQSNGCIKSKEGKILFERDKVLERWSEYVGDLFADTRPALPTPSNNEGPPIIPAEVRNALRKTQSGKAPGEDGITTEMLKQLEDYGVEKLTELYNDIYTTGHIPEELLLSVYITLPKKPRATECADFRTISLMPHTLKIFLKIIQERINKRIDREVGKTQFGFRPCSGTREGLFAYNILAQKYIEVDQELYTCFIDYSKAFDRVHHDQLIKCLERIGLDGKDIRIITNLYWHQKAVIRIDNELSAYTPIQRGVRQGCVLSPYLFNIYTEFIFREVDELKGISINGKNLNNIRYADDTALMADSEEKLQKIVDEVKHHSSKGGLEMNVKKTKVMLITRKPERPIEIKVDDASLERVHMFKYLGTQITEDARTETELKHRMYAAKAKFSSMNSILTSKQLKLPLKLRVLKCYIMSIFTYGCETWTLTDVLEDKIEAFEMWCFRRIGRISWKDKITNQDVLQRIGTERNLLKCIKQRQLRYYGHIKRKSGFLAEILEGKVEGKRPRGRPRNNWMGNISKWTGEKKRDCTRMAMDRHLWSVIGSQPLEKR